jgi:uncharacterized protein YbjT (DUF2867 family)
VQAVPALDVAGGGEVALRPNPLFGGMAVLLVALAKSEGLLGASALEGRMRRLQPIQGGLLPCKAALGIDDRDVGAVCTVASRSSTRSRRARSSAGKVVGLPIAVLDLEPALGRGGIQHICTVTFA